MSRTSNGLAALFGRLTDAKDRETYAALISFVDSLPEGDELFRIVELLGLLSLIGQRVPDAVAEFLTELRSQTKAAATYYGQVDARLAALPQEIAAGVDTVAIANSMSHVFRQRLAATGLQATAELLKVATTTIKALSDDLTATLKPAGADYRAIVSSISDEVKKLDAAARLVEEHNARLMARERSNRWALQAVGVLLLFVVGGLCGIVLEKRQTVDVLRDLGLRMERAERPASVPIVEIPGKKKNGS
jgi:hypothetical protein